MEFFGSKLGTYSRRGRLSHIWLNWDPFRQKFCSKSKISKIGHFSTLEPHIRFGDFDSGNWATALNPITMCRVHVGLNPAIRVNPIGYHAGRQSQLTSAFQSRENHWIFFFTMKKTCFPWAEPRTVPAQGSAWMSSRLLPRVLGFKAL
jgi:hypothetical protein